MGNYGRATLSALPVRSLSGKYTRRSDSWLVQECLKGNESAWSALIDKYKNLIFSIPIKYGFSQEDSADIFQSVCIDLLSHLGRLREPNALAAWLIQVTRNKCFHHRHELDSSNEDLDESKSQTSEKLPETVILEAQKEERLRRILRELPPRCRELVEMLFFEQPARQYKEVAKELGLASGSIGLIRRRCLDGLRRRLEQEGLKKA